MGDDKNECVINGVRVIGGRLGQDADTRLAVTRPQDPDEFPASEPLWLLVMLVLVLLGSAALFVFLLLNLNPVPRSLGLLVAAVTLLFCAGLVAGRGVRV